MKDKAILDIASTYKRIMICGTGDLGRYIENLVTTSFSEKEVMLCDNSKKKQLNGVISIEEACNKYKDSIFLLSTRCSNSVLAKQILEYNISEKQIFDAVTDEALRFVEDKNYKRKTIPLAKIQFEVDIVSHCNLNCKCCSQFSCIADEEFIDCKVMERDFKRLGELFLGECERIYLIGGEPLLHPNIENCISIARTYFPKGKISIFTNGLLLLKQSDTFWKTCKNNDITLIITRYPIRLDYESIISLAKKNDVLLEFFGTSEDFKYMNNLGLDISGGQDIKKSFSMCGEANNCIKLKNGRLYTCTRPAAIYKFNKFFKKNLIVTERDSIDIYKASSEKEILDFLAKPISFCKYCSFETRRSMEWGQTKGDINEWL